MIRKLWDSADAFAALRPGWQALYDRCPDAPIFLSWEWSSIWWTHFGSDRRLQLITFSEGDQLVGIAPLMTDRDRPGLRLLSSQETTDYADLLALPSHAPDCVDALFNDWTAQNDDVLLEPLAERSLLLRGFQDRQASGTRGDALRLEPCPTVELPATWDQYLAGLRKTDRHELRRKIRRAESTGALSYEVLRDPASVEGQLDAFYRLHQSSGDPRKAHFLQPAIRGFFSDVSLALAARGWLRLALLRLAERPIAALLGFDRGTTVALYNSGYDPEYRSIAPGIVLLAYELRAAIEAGRTTYDFLRGDEPYKYDFGAQDHFIWRVCLGPHHDACPDGVGSE